MERLTMVYFLFASTTESAAIIGVKLGEGYTDLWVVGVPIFA